MNKICQDVFNNIGEYLSIIDIAKLKKTNKLLRFFVINLEEIYLTKQLKNINNDFNMQVKKKYFYTSMKFIIYDLYNNKDVFKNTILKNTILNNRILNNIILNIYKSNFYLNILDMFILNCFINIVYFPDKIDINSALHFLKNFNKQDYFSKFHDIIIYYYIYVLYYIHDDKVVYNKFKIMYDISPYVTNIYCLSKIISYRVLDLSKTDFICCCNLERCVVDNIYNICDTKYSYYNDDLISHNYIEIKTLLYNYSIEYYNILINRENDLLNKKIFVKNPITNRRMRVNGKQWDHVICNLKKKNKYIYNNMVEDIVQQQNILRNKIFGRFAINN
jgi:hypothetical protein